MVEEVEESHFTMTSKKSCDFLRPDVGDSTQSEYNFQTSFVTKLTIRE